MEKKAGYIVTAWNFFFQIQIPLKHVFILIWPLRFGKRFGKNFLFPHKIVILQQS